MNVKNVDVTDVDVDVQEHRCETPERVYKYLVTWCRRCGHHQPRYENLSALTWL